MSNKNIVTGQLASITTYDSVTSQVEGVSAVTVTANTLSIDAGSIDGFAIGYRDLPQVTLSANTTLDATDAGKHYYSELSTTNTITIPDNSIVEWSAGTAITIINLGTGNVSVARGTNVNLYLAGNSTSTNRVITTYGMATIVNVSANTWMINGTGVE